MFLKHAIYKSINNTTLCKEFQILLQVSNKLLSGQLNIENYLIFEAYACWVKFLEQTILYRLLVEIPCKAFTPCSGEALSEYKIKVKYILTAEDIMSVVALFYLPYKNGIK